MLHQNWFQHVACSIGAKLLKSVYFLPVAVHCSMLVQSSTRPSHGLLYIWTELLSIFFSWSAHMRHQNYTQGVDFFWPWPSLILKSSHQDLSWRVKLYFESTRSWSLSCSNTAIFDKLHEFTDFGFLQQSQNRVRFWIC